MESGRYDQSEGSPYAPAARAAAAQAVTAKLEQAEANLLKSMDATILEFEVRAAEEVARLAAGATGVCICPVPIRRAAVVPPSDPHAAQHLACSPAPLPCQHRPSHRRVRMSLATC